MDFNFHKNWRIIKKDIKTDEETSVPLLDPNYTETELSTDTDLIKKNEVGKANYI